jgi:prepilin-type N-terminal cleavage/methylation domain-containing protein
MISRTGNSGALLSCGPQRRRGFTLIELLVVIAIIGLLTGVLVPVLLRARSSAKMRWALKELNELKAVISLYHQDQSAYPPDTFEWATKGGNAEDPHPDVPSHDPLSINRYLGKKVVNWRGEEYPAYMAMTWDRVEGRDPIDRAGVFMDPYETPYELDAMHMIPPDPADPGSGYKQCGWPYILASPGDPSRGEKLRMVLDFKFVSYGVDKESVDYPFDMGSLRSTPVIKRPGKAADDVCSWR